MSTDFSKNLFRDFLIFTSVIFLLVIIIGALTYVEYILIGTGYLGIFLFAISMGPALAFSLTSPHTLDEKIFVIVLILTIIFYLISLFSVFVLGRLIIKSVLVNRNMSSNNRR